MTNNFYQAYRNRHQLAGQWKESGRKIFGYFCLYAPQELLYAAGVIPVCIRGSRKNPSLAYAFLPEFVCSYQRSRLNEAMAGRYRYLDGLIFNQRCDINRVIGRIWTEQLRIPYSWHLAIPRKGSESAIKVYIEELNIFKQSLEEYMACKIDTQSLNNAIKVYNENRSLRRRIYELSLSDNPPLSGSQIIEIMLSGLVMPKDEHNKMLRELLRNIPDEGSSNKVRLLITGNTLENIDIIRAIEDNGGQIVIDDYCFGTRDCWHKIGNVDDPLYGIADYYLNRRIPSPCTDSPERHRIRHILQLASQYRVHGVIHTSQNYCDNYLLEMPQLKERLRDYGIPMINIEIDDAETDMTRVDNLIQPFIEMLY